MHALQNLIEDPDVLVALPCEELAAKILFLLRRNPEALSGGMFSQHNLALEFDRRDDWRATQYPQNKISAVKEAFFEAWAWLESRGLLIWPDSSNGSNGWRKLSRRAQAFESERDYLAYSTGKYLRPDMLHPSIAQEVWLDFARADFDVAIFRAMRQVEISVRLMGNFADNIVGVDLMRKAFHPDNGPLTDLNEPFSEREALLSLFAGAMGRFKNPQSHRAVSTNDVRDAIEIILLANHLLKIVDGRSRG